MKDIILYIGGFIPPAGNAAAHRVMANAKIMRDLGYEVVLLGTTKDPVLLKDDVLDSKQEIQGFQTYFEAYPGSLGQWLKHLFSIEPAKQLITSLGEDRVKGVVAYNYPSIALNKLVKYCRTRNIKLISDCTEWALVEHNKGPRNTLKNWDTQYRMKVVHSRMGGIITISDFLYRYYLPQAPKVLKLPPLVDVKPDSEEQLLNSVNLEEGIKLVYAGSPGNGGKDRIDTIVKVLSEIKSACKCPFTLNVVGITREQYLSDFKEKHIPVNVSENVSFMGRLPHEQVIEIVRSAHFTIFIRDENRITQAGFPTKFVESISNGTPVLTNKTSNIEEYLLEGKTGYFLDTSSEDNLKVSMLKVINDATEDLILQMKKECYNLCMFHYENYTGAFDAFLENVFNPKAASKIHN